MVLQSALLLLSSCLIIFFSVALFFSDSAAFEASPLVVSSALYSAIVDTKLRLLHGINSSAHTLDPKPDKLRSDSFWQFGKGSHSSTKSRILGSILLFAVFDNGECISIRHMVIGGSSQ